MEEGKLEQSRRDMKYFGKAAVGAWFLGALFSESASKGGKAFELFCYLVAAGAALKLFIAVAGFLTYRFGQEGSRRVQVGIAACSLIIPATVMYSYDSVDYRMWEWYGYPVPLGLVVAAFILTIAAASAGKYVRSTDVRRWGLAFSSLAGAVLFLVLMREGNFVSDQKRLVREIKNAVGYEQRQTFEEEQRLADIQHVPASALFLVGTVAAYAGMCIGRGREPLRATNKLD